jgi:periodic tryptophan protein 2
MRFSLHGGNRHKSTTLDIETRSNISRIAVSHNGRILLAVDEGGKLHGSCHSRLRCDLLPFADGAAVVINLQRHILIHRMNFKEKVRDVRFSPDDTFIAVAVGRKLQVWRTPEMRREFAPFVLHRTYTGHFDDVSCVSWSPNGRYILGSRLVGWFLCRLTIPRCCVGSLSLVPRT